MYQNLLEQLYNTYNASGRFQVDFTYLMKAISDIDDLWNFNIGFVTNVKLVILGEAPLWGKVKGKESYIYNLKSNPTGFFSTKHFNKGYNVELNDKRSLISATNDKGIVFIDILPFPLNPKITAICYCDPQEKASSQINFDEYEDLIRISFNTYLKPKLEKIEAIAKRNKNKINWLYRYKRVEDHHLTIAGLCKPERCRFPSLNDIIRISQRGGQINQDTLNSVLLKI